MVSVILPLSSYGTAVLADLYAAPALVTIPSVAVTPFVKFVTRVLLDPTAGGI